MNEEYENRNDNKKRINALEKKRRRLEEEGTTNSNTHRLHESMLPISLSIHTGNIIPRSIRRRRIRHILTTTTTTTTTIPIAIHTRSRRKVRLLLDPLCSMCRMVLMRQSMSRPRRCCLAMEMVLMMLVVMLVMVDICRRRSWETSMIGMVHRSVRNISPVVTITICIRSVAYWRRRGWSSSIHHIDSSWFQNLTQRSKCDVFLRYMLLAFMETFPLRKRM